MSPEAEERRKWDRIGAASEQGVREMKRVWAEEFPGKKLHADLLPKPGPLDKLTDEEYARYVEMTKAAESGDRASLERLLEQAAETASATT